MSSQDPPRDAVEPGGVGVGILEGVQSIEDHFEGVVGGVFGGREITMTESGSYRVENLEPGEYELTVLGSGFGGEPLARETAFVKSGEQREVDLTSEG